MLSLHGLLFCHRSAVALCMVFVFPFPISLRADESERLKARFIAEAPRAWEEYRAYAERLQGTEKSEVILDGKILSNARREYKSNPRCRMLIFHSLGEHSKEGVEAFNPLYGFSLKRGASDAAWILADFQMGGFPRELQNGEEFSPLRTCINATTMHELPELVRLPNFHVVHARMIQHGGEELCRIDFESKQATGTLLLDPSRFWTMHHSTIREKSRDIIVVATQDIELRDPAAKHPIPKSVVIDKEFNYPKNSKRTARIVVEFDLKEASPPPDDKEFTLSAFELPEPVGVEPIPPSRTWLWLLAAAVAAAGLAILFSWLKRRHTGAVSRSSAAS